MGSFTTFIPPRRQNPQLVLTNFYLYQAASFQNLVTIGRLTMFVAKESHSNPRNTNPHWLANKHLISAISIEKSPIGSQMYICCIFKKKQTAQTPPGEKKPGGEYHWVHHDSTEK